MWVNLADLAVRASDQRRGIGIEMLRKPRQNGTRSMPVLLAAAKAVDYYPKSASRAMNVLGPPRR